MSEQAYSILAIGMPQGIDWIIILIIAVLLFGRRLPDIARSIGKSLTEFKKGVNEAKNDINKSVDEDINTKDIPHKVDSVNGTKE